MIAAIKTSAWTNFKNLRFSLLHYMMLVIIFPCSYLVISLVSNSGVRSLEDYLVGLFCSMIFSLFLNMQASLIAGSNSIPAMEQYATYKVRALFVHIGNGLFHSILSLPLLFVLVIIGIIKGAGINMLLLIPAWLFSVLFLSFLSIVLGGLFQNPNVASPIINMLYMIIVMITPFYGNLGQLSGMSKILYCINPFAHCLSLFSGGLARPMICNPVISVIILLVLTLLLGLFSVKRWYNNKAVEKLGVY